MPNIKFRRAVVQMWFSNIGDTAVKNAVTVGVEIISQSPFSELVEHLSESVVGSEHQIMSIILTKLRIHTLVVGLAFIGDIGDLSPAIVQPIVYEGARRRVTDISGKTVVVFPGVTSYTSRPN